jgi:ribose/xylose/arabinose/galactoside ABC-type transport system permease subunit
MTGYRAWARRAQAASPVVTLVVMLAVFLVLPATHGHDFAWFSVFEVMQIFGTYGLLALALGLTMIAGEFDLSTLGMFGLGGMLAVKLGVDEPLLGVLAAVAVGALAGVAQGTVISRLGIDSMSVTLGGFLVLLGLTATIGADETVTYDNVDVGLRLDDPILTVLSLKSIIAIAGFVLIGLAMHFTRIGREVRAIGGDRRTSRVAGVRVDLVVVLVFATSGVLAGLAGALNSFSLASALPNPGFPPLVFAATAGLIGGIAIAGGQGTAAGIAAGTLALSLLQTTFGILASPGWVSDTVTGILLVVAVLLAAPELVDRVRSARQGWTRPRTRERAT